MNGVCFTYYRESKDAPVVVKDILEILKKAENTVLPTPDDLSKFIAMVIMHINGLKNTDGKKYMLCSVSFPRGGNLRLCYKHPSGCQHLVAELGYVAVRGICRYDSKVMSFFDISERFEYE